MERGLLLQQFLRMMSELNKDPTQLDNSTQTFILKKCQTAPDSMHSNETTTQALQQEQLVCKRSVVSFNADSKFYTPAFIDPTERGAVTAADDRLREVFLEKVEEAQSKKQMFVPKPSSHFCFVCREHFTDYFKVLYVLRKHVAHPVHHKNVASSGPQELIEQLIEEFGRKQRRGPTVGFGGVLEAGRKRCKVQEGQCGRAREEGIFKDNSTCLPSQIQSHQIKFRRN